MREIKFRGKRVDNGDWVYGYYAKWQGDHVIFPFDPMGRMRKIDPSKVGQYTGLIDKNGKDAYEADLLRDDSGLIWLIFWDAYTAGFYMALQSSKKKFDGRIGPLTTRLQAYTMGNKEIIGNIHDNPELLQQH